VVHDSGYLDYGGAFQTVLLLRNELKIADRVGLWDTSVSDNNWGVQHHRIFIVVTLITNVLFKQFLIHTAV